LEISHEYEIALMIRRKIATLTLLNPAAQNSGNISARRVGSFRHFMEKQYPARHLGSFATRTDVEPNASALAYELIRRPGESNP
jgi:hypothetical protein